MNENDINELGKNIIALQKEAVNQTLLFWKPKAEQIIRTKSRDINEIEHTLDALCEVAFDDEVLALFKRLCRYYYYIDQQATIQQIQFYREMWDNNDEIESDE
ncbi:MAG: hypothetical protein U9R42_03560 [Bacteroidota bacterium]|nr:hypothetical protein [Bacteroidota bacterium]